MTTPVTPNQPTCPLAIFERTLSALRDEVLSPAEIARVTAHVETCPACHARLDEYDALASALRSERPPEPDERLWREFAAATSRSGRGHGARFAGVALSRQSWSRLGAVAAVLLLTVGFLTVSSLHHSGVSVRLTPTVTLAPTSTTTPAPTATPDLLPAHPLAWQPAATGSPGEVTVAADDGESAYACSVTANVQVDGFISIFWTADRGATWTRAQSVPYTPTANGCELVVDASDPSVAALAWAPRGGGAGDSYTNLMTTVDGGATWQAQPTQPFSRIDQLDSRGGVIYALRETADSAGSVEYHLWASSDRMQSWRQVDAGQTLSAAVAGFWLQPDGPGILAVVNGGASALPTQLFYSPSDGATWNHLSVPGGLPPNYAPARFFSAGGPPNGVVARSIQGRFHICVSNATAGAPVSSGQTPVVTCSHDSGATWQSRRLLVVATPQQSNLAVNFVGIADNGDLLGSGASTLYRLVSGTDKWQSLGTYPLSEVVYCSMPGNGLLMAIPSGPPPPGSIYVLYSATYAP